MLQGFSIVGVVTSRRQWGEETDLQVSLSIQVDNPAFRGFVDVRGSAKLVGRDVVEGEHVHCAVVIRAGKAAPWAQIVAVQVYAE